LKFKKVLNSLGINLILTTLNIVLLYQSYIQYWNSNGFSSEKRDIIDDIGDSMILDFIKCDVYYRDIIFNHLCSRQF